MIEVLLTVVAVLGAWGFFVWVLHRYDREVVEPRPEIRPEVEIVFRVHAEVMVKAMKQIEESMRRVAEGIAKMHKPMREFAERLRPDLIEGLTLENCPFCAPDERCAYHVDTVAS